MKIIILFESFFGNTEQIAREMGTSTIYKVDVFHYSEISWKQISDADYLIVGSPTRGFRPCELTKQFLRSIPGKGLKGTNTDLYLINCPINSLRALLNLKYQSALYQNFLVSRLTPIMV